MNQDIPHILHLQKQYFTSNATKPLTARLKALSCLQDSIKAHEDEILYALSKDLNKCKEEAYISEIFQVYEEIKSAKQWVKSLSKPKRVKTPLSHFG